MPRLDQWSAVSNAPMQRMRTRLAIPAAILCGLSVSTLHGCSSEVEKACKHLTELAEKEGTKDWPEARRDQCIETMRRRVETRCSNPKDVYKCIARVDDLVSYVKTCRHEIVIARFQGANVISELGQQFFNRKNTPARLAVQIDDLVFRQFRSDTL